MTVIDAQGRPVGKVTRVAMGQPDAATTRGNEPASDVARETVLAPRPAADGGVLMPAISPDASEIDSDVPAPLRSELRRAGFVEVDGPDLHGWARYIPGDRVADVVGETVRLRPDPTTVMNPPAAPAEARPAVAPATAPAAAPEPRPGPGGRSGWTWPPVWLASGLLVGCGSVVAGGLVYRRRREQARLSGRLRRASRTAISKVAEHDGTARGGLGVSLLLLLLVVRRAFRADDRSAALASVHDRGVARDPLRRPIRQPGRPRKRPTRGVDSTERLGR
jgi:hypothetical protein